VLKLAQYVMEDHFTGGVPTQANDLPGCAAVTKRATMNRIEDVELNQP
jgi:hypothetical protein